MHTVVAGIKGRVRPWERARRNGFTLLELLVVIGIIALLSGLLLPALARSRAKAGSLACMGNAKQLTLACLLYAADTDDRLPYNVGGGRGTPVPPQTLDLNWVNNTMSWELDSDNTNTAFMARSPLARYVPGALTSFTCPSDHVLSPVQRRAGWLRRVRSYSMNAMVGNAGPTMYRGTNLNNPDYRQFLKLSDIRDPANIFVFLDEHPDSINDAYFLNLADDLVWVDLPASYHNGAASFSFADGHVEAHRWLFGETKPPSRPDAAPLPFAVPPARRGDYDWLMVRTSVER
jgi:prepilin-type N-terminal cleavage/methylation domain-containing protein/prepilin-type processing-associated H-X9-DG protein